MQSVEFRVANFRLRVKSRGCRSEENNYFTETCSDSEAGSYSRPIDFAYHSTLGLTVIKKKQKGSGSRISSECDKGFKISGVRVVVRV